jgi:hypothetical protein
MLRLAPKGISGSEHDAVGLAIEVPTSSVLASKATERIILLQTVIDDEYNE